MTEIPPLCGLVLSGGQSERMGRDKGAIPWEGGKLVHVQAQKLLSVVREVWISCRPEQEETYAGSYPLLFDQYPSEGPMSGLLSAFHARPASAWLVLGVDMPGIGEEVLRHLVDHRDPGRLATAFRQPDGVVQPLVSVWEPAALSLLRKAWSERRLSLRQWLEENEVLLLEPPGGSDWTNVNAPSDLKLS